MTSYEDQLKKLEQELSEASKRGELPQYKPNEALTTKAQEDWQTLYRGNAEALKGGWSLPSADDAARAQAQGRP